MRLLQLVSEAVLTHLADKGAGFAQLAQHGQHNGRGPAGADFVDGIALVTEPILGEVHQQLPQRNKIKILRYDLRFSAPRKWINVFRTAPGPDISSRTMASILSPMPAA